MIELARQYGRYGYRRIAALLRDAGWGITVKAVKTGTELVGFVQELINDLKPDVVVTEKCDKNSRKGKNTRQLIQSVAVLASHNEVLDVSVPRPRKYPSKYEEAEELVKRYPDVAG